MADFSENPEIAELRSVVRSIAAKYGGADYAEHGRRAEPQHALWKELADSGFIGINVPEEYGGGGAGMSELAVVAQEAAIAGCPLLLMLVSSAIAVEVLKRHGSEDQRAEWLPKLAAGHTKIAFAITEPDAGSNSHQISTAARRLVQARRSDGEDFRRQADSRDKPEGHRRQARRDRRRRGRRHHGGLRGRPIQGHARAG